MGMIKKVIKGIKKLKGVFIPKSEFIEPKKINKTKVQSDYIGVPAPVVLSDDSWFGVATKTEKAIEYVKQKNEELYQKLAEEPQSKEVDNIHQMMYDRVTQYWGTWKEELSDSPGDWQSGTGYNQFRD
jgi:hypothetical protein